VSKYQQDERLPDRSITYSGLREMNKAPLCEPTISQGEYLAVVEQVFAQAR